MARTATVQVSVQLQLPAELLTLAAIAALHRPGPWVAIVTRAIRDQADELPRHVLDDLHDVIGTWLHREGLHAPQFDRDPWRIALAAVRSARQPAPAHRPTPPTEETP